MPEFETVADWQDAMDGAKSLKEEAAKRGDEATAKAWNREAVRLLSVHPRYNASAPRTATDDRSA